MLVRCSSPHLWRGRRDLFQALYLLQKVAPVDNVIKLDRRLPATKVFDQLFDGVARILCMDAHCAQVSGISQPGEQMGKRVSSLECQSAGLVGAADEILHQNELDEQGRR